MTTLNRTLCIGIDVSKETLDIYYQDTSYKIKNEQTAIACFIETHLLKELPNPMLAVLESTGGYEKLAIHLFHQYGIPIHKAHPNDIHAFAQLEGHFAKTDKLDAFLIYKYAVYVSEKEHGDIELSPIQQEIISLRQQQRALETDLHRAQCRLEHQKNTKSGKYLRRQIAFCKDQLAAIQREIDELIARDPDLTEKRDIMISMKGVGKKTASALLAEMPELGTLSSKQAASLAGLAPKTYQSGKKTLAGHIAGGRFYVRKSVYMAALVAARYNAHLRDIYQSMKERGKPKKVALTALMRKVIVTLNAMLKKREKYAYST